MTAKEKAMELIKEYAPFINDYHDQTEMHYIKMCALICVDELIKSFSKYKGMYEQEQFESEAQYWEKVKKEIEVL